MKVVSATNVGNYRKNNEDSFYVNESKNLYLLADGMGGHLAGERASKMATEIIGEDFASEREVVSIDDALEMPIKKFMKAPKKMEIIGEWEPLYQVDLFWIMFLFILI